MSGLRALVLLMGLLSLSGAIFVPKWASAAVLCHQASCLDAHDINGIQLGMTINQVSHHFLSTIESIGRGQYKIKIGRSSYDFGFTSLGHLYRIDYSEILGKFVPDNNFGAQLTAKLSAKYGPPETNSLPGGPAFWQFVERDKSGAISVNRETESLSVMLGHGYNQPVTLDMKLMDFRILLRDLTSLNARPEKMAKSRIHF